MAEVRSLDLTPTSAPALSTTSDMPTAATKLPAPKGAVSEEEIRKGEEAGKKGDEIEAAKRAAKAKTTDDKDDLVEKADKKAAEDKVDDNKDDDEVKKDETPAW